MVIKLVRHKNKASPYFRGIFSSTVGYFFNIYSELFFYKNIVSNSNKFLNVSLQTNQTQY